MTQPVQERAAQTVGRLVDDLVAAERAGKPKIWRKMSTIMSMMGTQRLTTSFRSSLAQELSRHGVIIEPPLDEVLRTTTIRLSRRDRPEMPDVIARPGGIGQPPPGVEHARAWLSGRPRDIGQWPPTLPGANDFVVLELDPTVDAETIQQSLLQALKLEIPIALVNDLVSPDPAFLARPAEGLDAFHLAVAGAVAREEEGEATGSGASVAGWTDIQPLELLVGPKWAIVVWHRSEAVGPTGELLEDRPPVLDDIRSGMRAEPCASSHNYLTQLIEQLLEGYEPVAAAHRGWLDAWETQETRALSPHLHADASDLDSLAAIRRHIQQTRRRLQGHERIIAGYERSSNPSSDLIAEIQELSAWAKDLSGEFRDLDRELRTSLETLRSRQLSEERDRQAQSAREEQQAREEAREQEQQARRSLERKIALISALLLGPSLVAAFFGANVLLPGQNQLPGTVLMLVCMLTVTAVTYAVLNRK